MQFDFSKLAIPSVSAPQSDPYKIFAGLPRLEGAPNDLWSGQSEALAEWNKNRTDSDVLVSLNTGAGKTLVGILIAKSFCNEGLENVLYVCPTNDLVKQTAAQARAVGIDVTTRMGGRYDNDLFEIGRTFCITNYNAVFNGMSSLRRRHFPDAIIFDDAHVAESNMRDAFTLTIKSDSSPALHAALINLLLHSFRELNREGEYRDALDVSRPPNAVLVPPDAVRTNIAQIEASFRAACVDNHDNMKYAYQHLKDHLSVCAVVIRANVIEFTPPFLPSLAMDVFSRKLRRVYLSATLQNKADMVRAFGRAPNIVIEPNNDAGNGERLIIAERGLTAGIIDARFGQTIQQKHKVLVAVPSYKQAKQWESLTTPPDVNEFSESLDVFRRSARGSFVLVNRVDGIDLPHDSCRVMILDGIPRSEGLLERYQFEYLDMRTFAASRIANRLVQLFGRINRGRADYGAFLISGRELNIWLANDKNIALLPELLKRQILLGRNVQSGMNVTTLSAVASLLDTVLLSKPRDQGWLGFYSQYLNSQDVDDEKSERAQRTEARNLEAAKAEALYAKAMWERDFISARTALDSIVAETARADEKLAGWHNLWIGAALDQEGDTDQAHLYFAKARGQLGLNLVVSTGVVGLASLGEKPTRRIVAHSLMMTNLGRETFTKQLGKLTDQLSVIDVGTPPQTEEAIRLLGDTLGFSASRPDNDDGTGPDILWHDLENNLVLGIELKTDKIPGSSYSKSDISQSLDHLSWISDHSNGANSLGCLLVGPANGSHSQANPTSELYHTNAAVFAKLRDKLLAILRDAYERPTNDRAAFLEAATEGLGLDKLGTELNAVPLKAA
jgi:hypothetical protein